jgi:hypothetical protein
MSPYNVAITFASSFPFILPSRRLVRATSARFCSVYKAEICFVIGTIHVRERYHYHVS